MTELGITSKLDLPVGYNLQDHVSYSMYWNTPYVRFNSVSQQALISELSR
jgi:hypothetical protein